MASLDTQLGFRMHAERTPNPHSIKWVLGAPVAPEGSGGASFQQAPDEAVSPLAARLFAVEGVVSVFFAANFVSVTKRPEVEWTQLAQPIVDAIKQVLEDRPWIRQESGWQSRPVVGQGGRNRQSVSDRLLPGIEPY